MHFHIYYFPPSSKFLCSHFTCLVIKQTLITIQSYIALLCFHIWHASLIHRTEPRRRLWEILFKTTAHFFHDICFPHFSRAISSKIGSNCELCNVSVSSSQYICLPCWQLFPLFLSDSCCSNIGKNPFTHCNILPQPLLQVAPSLSSITGKGWKMTNTFKHTCSND